MWGVSVTADKVVPSKLLLDTQTLETLQGVFALSLTIATITVKTTGCSWNAVHRFFAVIYVSVSFHRPTSLVSFEFFFFLSFLAYLGSIRMLQHTSVVLTLCWPIFNLLDIDYFRKWLTIFTLWQQGRPMSILKNLLSYLYTVFISVTCTCGLPVKGQVHPKKWNSCQYRLPCRWKVG